MRRGHRPSIHGDRGVCSARAYNSIICGVVFEYSFRAANRGTIIQTGKPMRI